ncbi:hypothetical protein M0811_03049 [Anaeramoeba ignava]|uniref:WH2 domain-containing protein n=1 Tax=Anaeramoeba ignava TaxID=1746090 RepID=A0A9Q0R6K8_ANAIG|nr:hypothetical protein M0811_03049 [Anaeramoeba ignava]
MVLIKHTIKGYGKQAPPLKSPTETVIDVVRDRSQSFLTGLLLQLRDLATYSHSIFSELVSVSQEMTTKIQKLSARATVVLDERLPRVEEKMNETDPLSFCNNPKAEYKANLGEDYQLFKHAEIPQTLSVRFEQCQKVPDFSAIDQLAGLKNGSTLKHYSSPGFFFEKWVAVQIEKQKKRIEEQKQRRQTRKHKTRTSRNTQKKSVKKIQKKTVHAMGAEFDTSYVASPKTSHQQNVPKSTQVEMQITSLPPPVIDGLPEIPDLPKRGPPLPTRGPPPPTGGPPPPTGGPPPPTGGPPPPTGGPPPPTGGPPPPKLGPPPPLSGPPPPISGPPNLSGMLNSANLRHVQPVEKKDDGRSNLMQQIRAGKTLRDASKRQLAEKALDVQDVQSLSVAEILMKTMSIRAAVQFSESESESETDDDWD